VIGAGILGMLTTSASARRLQATAQLSHIPRPSEFPANPRKAVHRVAPTPLSTRLHPYVCSFCSSHAAIPSTTSTTTSVSCPFTA